MSNVIKKVFNTDKAEGEAGNKIGETTQGATSKTEHAGGIFHRGEEGAKQVRDAVVARVPLKVASTAEDIANLVCFLASPASSNMTGEFVRMDAGMHLIQ